jgi:antitoxin (DNA-binding transcriptional repressor) of toxin-antitoxin stability system
MREIAPLRQKTGLVSCSIWVEQGEEVVITRHGTAVARLVPPKTGFSRPEAREAAQGIREMSRGVTLGGLRLKDSIDEGRQ